MFAQTEYENEEILAFYCGGPKQYSIRLKAADDTSDQPQYREIQKIRGCTLDSETKEYFNWDAFKKMINEFGIVQQPIPVMRTNFMPDFRTGTVHTRMLCRRYKPFYDKGIVDLNHECLPWGYQGPPPKNPLADHH